MISLIKSYKFKFQEEILQIKISQKKLTLLLKDRHQIKIHCLEFSLERTLMIDNFLIHAMISLEPMAAQHTSISMNLRMILLMIKDKIKIKTVMMVRNNKKVKKMT